MIKARALMLSGVLAFCGATAAQAQVRTNTQGMTPGQIMQNVYMDNARGILESNGRMSGSSGDAELSAMRAELARMERVGAARIKAGKATTTFISNIQATESLARNANWEPDDPQDLPGQVKFIQRYVKMFNTLAGQNGFATNDFADGYAFAYALSYAAYHNRDMKPEEVKRIRDQRRDALLKMPNFQGDTDAVRQYLYELNAVMAMQAVEQRVKARRATNENEQRAAEEKARGYAQQILKTAAE